MSNKIKYSIDYNTNLTKSVIIKGGGASPGSLPSSFDISNCKEKPIDQLSSSKYNFFLGQKNGNKIEITDKIDDINKYLKQNKIPIYECNIQTKVNKETLYIFNDNQESMDNANPGGGNAVIRKYNM